MSGPILHQSWYIKDDKTTGTGVFVNQTVKAEEILADIAPE